MNLTGIHRFSDKKVSSGERYIFSAAFDVKHDLKSTERIDQEIPDIKRISDNGGITLLLSHQGRQEYGDVRHLDFVASYLSGKLGKGVHYFPSNHDSDAREFACTLKPGEIALLGNTRFHPGETQNDPELAKQFSELGDFVIVGGFTKAHRAHASNYGILDYLPGFLANSCIEQIELLSPWQGEREEHSVAVLGGLKKEKIKAVEGFARNYDYVIPGGIVLNTALKTLGYKIGDSVITDSGKSYEPDMEKVLKSYADKIYIPSLVRIARKTDNGFEEATWIDIKKGMPNGFSIVDFNLEENALKNLERAVSEKGRILVAGTPGIYAAGFDQATDHLMSYVNSSRVKSILLGGDTTNEIPFSRTKSTGGGSALEYLCSGKLAVCEALRKNSERFPIA